MSRKISSGSGGYFSFGFSQGFKAFGADFHFFAINLLPLQININATLGFDVGVAACGASDCPAAAFGTFESHIVMIK